MPTLKPPSLSDLADILDLETAASFGDFLSPQSAQVMEAVLLANPLDIVNRARLLGFYKRHCAGRKKRVAKKYLERRTAHILWFIENLPDCAFTGDIYLAVDKLSHGEIYNKVAQAWCKAIGRSSHNQVKINAALFYFRSDLQLAHKLTTEVLESDPENAWAEAILEIHKTAKERLAAPSQLELAKPFMGENCDPDIDWAKLCDQGHLHHGLIEGRRISKYTVKTLQKILAKHPDDISARAKLLSYYGHRCKRANILERDPECELLFVRHTLWFIRYALGARDLRGIQRFDYSKNAKRKLSLYLKEQLNYRAGQISSKDTKNIKNLFTSKVWALGNYPVKIRNKRHIKIYATGALDKIASLSNNFTLEHKKPAPALSLTEWANMSFLDSAKLFGAYEWFCPSHPAHLLEALEEQSLDLYSRAILLGFYASQERKSAAQMSSGKSQDDALLKMKSQHYWFIKNIPACDYLSAFSNWSDPAAMDLWKTVANSTTEANAIVNAAISYFEEDKMLAKEFLLTALKLDPENLLGRLLLEKITKRRKDRPIKALFKEYGFEPGSKSQELTTVANRLDLRWAWSFGDKIPERSAWTLEQVLPHNQNDIWLRVELLGTYWNPQFCFALRRSNPKNSQKQLMHWLWMAKNIPEVRLGPSIVGYDDLKAFKAIFLAWKLQVQAYPKNIKIAINAGHAGVSTKKTIPEVIEILERALKLHPTNESIKRRLEHYISLINR